MVAKRRDCSGTTKAFESGFPQSSSSISLCNKNTPALMNRQWFEKRGSKPVYIDECANHAFPSPIPFCKASQPTSNMVVSSPYFAAPLLSSTSSSGYRSKSVASRHFDSSLAVGDGAKKYSISLAARALDLTTATHQPRLNEFLRNQKTSTRHKCHVNSGSKPKCELDLSWTTDPELSTRAISIPNTSNSSPLFSRLSLCNLKLFQPRHEAKCSLTYDRPDDGPYKNKYLLRNRVVVENKENIPCRNNDITSEGSTIASQDSIKDFAALCSTPVVSVNYGKKITSIAESFKESMLKTRAELFVDTSARSLCGSPMRRSKRPYCFDEENKNVKCTYPPRNREKHLENPALFKKCNQTSPQASKVHSHSPVISPTLPLPTVQRNCRSILPELEAETVAKLLQGDFKKILVDFTIIDCRFPYEYVGGHIKDALNIYRPKDLLTQLLCPIEGLTAERHSSGECAPSTNEKCASASEDNAIIQEMTRSCHSPLSTHSDAEISEEMQRKLEEALHVRRSSFSKNKNCAIIFYCEYSSTRAPYLARCLRGFDRLINVTLHPFLCWPNVYVMRRGYKDFYQTHPDFCTPKSYVPMHSRVFKRQRRPSVGEDLQDQQKQFLEYYQQEVRHNEKELLRLVRTKTQDDEILQLFGNAASYKGPTGAHEFQSTAT